MASKKILVQLDIQAASSLTSPLSGFVGFSAKADGLYQKIGTAPELRLLTSADVQNAILADGSITGAVSQAQTFTLGVKLSNLTQGYIPYASGSTKLLSNSPIYTDGTNVGIGMTSLGADLHVNSNNGLIISRASNFDQKITILGGNGYGIASITSSYDLKFIGGTSPTYGYFQFSNSSGDLMRITQTGNVGIGTTIPGAKLEVFETNYLGAVAGNSQILSRFSGRTGNTFMHNEWLYRDSEGSDWNTARLHDGISVDTSFLTPGVSTRVWWERDPSNNIQSWGHAASTYMTIYGGNVGIGTMYPTASLHIKEGTAIAGTAPLKLTSGVNLTTPEIGAIEFSSSRLYFTPSSTRETVAFLSDITTASHAPITIGEIGSAPNSNGITLIGQVLNLEPASALYGGVLTNSAQTIAGAKTLSSLFTASAGIANNGSYTQSGTSLNTFTGNIRNTSLTASKVVFTDGSKNLTSTGIGTASQFIKGDGSLDSNTYITSGSISGFVPYTGANDNVNLGTFGLHSGDVSIDNALIVRNPNNSSYTDGGYLLVQTPSASYASLNFYSKDTSDSFGIIQITANPEEGISLRAISNDYSSDSYLEIRHWELGFYTNLQKRLEIAQNGSINAFGNTITSTGGFIGNASTATKLQTARTITIGNQSLSFDGTANLTYTLSGIGIPVGTASQYIRGDLSLATFPTIHTGSGASNRVTFWDGTNSLSSTSNLEWNNTSKNLSVTGGVSVNDVSSNSMSTNTLFTQAFQLGSYVTAGYVLTTDVNGNGTWQAPQGGGNIVSSVFGRTGTVVAVNGDYNTSQVTENTNLYFTDSRARVAISLTINGQSGASTYNNSTGILNVPNYSLTGLGGVPKTRTITINGEVQDLSANRTWNVGDLLSTGSYSNPSWLTSLAWSKITNKPTTFYGYGITETPWTSYLPLSGGTLTGDLNSKRIICQSIIGDDYNTGAIEILGSYDNTFYPTLGFHQPSKFAASIQLRGAIDFRLYAQGGTTYANLTTNKLISASLQIGTSTTSGYVLTTDANGNGTWQAPTGGGSYTLPTASASVLGCVKIGSGITISSGVISVSTNYEAPLTFSSGLTRSGNAISVTSGTYVPFVGADRDVNLASYSIYAYDFLVYSDINLKCNIEDIKMKKLDINYKQFEYKTSRGEKRYGVIAQELLSIAPEFVSESNNSYAVKYTDLLIYEVAQLKEEVKQLKSLLCR